MRKRRLQLRLFKKLHNLIPLLAFDFISCVIACPGPLLNIPTECKPRKDKQRKCKILELLFRQKRIIKISLQ